MACEEYNLWNIDPTMNRLKCSRHSICQSVVLQSFAISMAVTMSHRSANLNETNIFWNSIRFAEHVVIPSFLVQWSRSNALDQFWSEHIKSYYNDYSESDQLSRISILYIFFNDILFWKFHEIFRILLIHICFSSHNIRTLFIILTAESNVDQN